MEETLNNEPQTPVTTAEPQSAEDMSQAAQAAEELQQRLQQLEQESASFKDQYMRSAADLRNYKRRVEQERGVVNGNAGANILMKMLPILDDLDLAMAHAPEEVATSQWFNGVKLVQTKLQTVLEGEGVRPIQALGQQFDPNFHEAVMHENAGPDQAGKVTAELRRGYTLHDRVIRPTMVKVGEG